MDCFYLFSPCQELRSFLIEDNINCGSKKRELDELRRSEEQEKGFTVIKMWECQWWRLYKTSNDVKKHIREIFPYRRSLAAQQILEQKRKNIWLRSMRH